MIDWDLQVAIYDRLRTDANLAAVVADRVYDDVPQETPFPYVEIGEPVSTAWDDDCNTGSVSLVTIHVWSQYHGSREAQLALAAIYTALHNQPLGLVGGDNVVCQVQQQQVLRDPDGVTRHGVLTLRAIQTF